MLIRPEKPSDYAEIARVHARAFDNQGSVPAIVALQRQRPAFRAELSLLAEIDGKVAGHVLFMPEVIQLLDEAIPAIVVSPVGVAPEFQRQGIGGAIMLEGHRIARELGFTISFLLGHSDYYPRFGYRIRAYGSSSLTVHKSDFLSPEELTVRRPAETDLPQLATLWQNEERGVDFSIHPDDALLGWLSPDGKLNCSVFERDGEIVGYARYHTGTAPSVAMFLSRDDVSARQMAHYLCAAQDTITLPLHPSSRSASAFSSKPEASAWDAAMACELEPGALAAYFSALEAGGRIPGRAIWPPPFDCAE